MFCKNCGKEIEDNTKFCPHCGTDINSKFLFFNKKIIIILILVLTLIIGLVTALLIQNNNKTATITIKGNNIPIEQALNFYPDFIGSKVMIKVSTKNIFKPINKQIMNSTQYKLEQNLTKNHYFDATVIQISKDKFIIYIPNEFDKKEIEKVLIMKPILTFKKRQHF